MNRLLRVLHTPPARLLRTLAGAAVQDIAVIRPCPGAETLPAMGPCPFVPLPGPAADPLLYTRGSGDWLFFAAPDGAGQSSILAAELDADGRAGTPHTVLAEPFGLRFPTVFDWNGETWMLPDTGADRSVTLYRCLTFPGRWERAARLDTDTALCCPVLLDAAPDALTLLFSEGKPNAEPLARWRCRTLQLTGEGFALTADDAFDLRWREHSLAGRSAGPLFGHGGQTVHPVRSGSGTDDSAWLQFYLRKGEKMTPLCAVGPQSVTVTGVAGKDIIGLDTYCRTPRWEVLGLRVLSRPKKEA